MTIGRGWRWWVADGNPVIEARVTGGGLLALIGEAADGLAAWAHAIDPLRPVFDLQGVRRPPTVRQIRTVFEAAPLPIVIAGRAERVTRALGASVQPYFAWTSPLSSRAGDAVALLEAAMMECAGRRIGLADLGWRGEELRAYAWRGLGELHRAAPVLAALAIEANNVTRAADRLQISRQALQRFLARRLWNTSSTASAITSPGISKENR